MKVGFLITARLKSTRLPKKLLLEIKDKPVINHLVDRVKLAKKVDEIVICTSTAEQDRPLAEVAAANGINCYFGHPDDVLSRLLGAAEKYELDYILNITADCPFVDPCYADNIVEQYTENNADLIRQFDLPHGVFSYGIKVEALRKVINLKQSEDTEVWGRYFTDTGFFDVVDLAVENSFHRRPGLRMTLDYPEDLEFFLAIFDALYKQGEVFTLDEILTFLDQNPDVVKINSQCGQKFRKRFYCQSEPKLKKINTVSTALIIGSGSIGQRHIRNLRKVGVDTVFALRSRKGNFKRLPDDLEVIEVDTWDMALNQNPDIAIISNPTALHIESALRVVPFVKGVMIEKPLSHSLEGTGNLIETLAKNRVVSFMGHNLMFHPIVNEIKRFADNYDVGNILNIQCQVGQWLPDWHPYEDYTKAYYANKHLGGGVALTLIHEIYLALDLAGLPKQVFGIISDSEKLNLDVDICADLMIKHQAGAVSQIHLDYLQKPAHRNGSITFEKGWLTYDFNEMSLIGQGPEDSSPNIKWKDPAYDYNLMYVEQMQRFLQYVEEGRMKHPFNVSTSLESLKVVEALFESDRTASRVDIKRNERFTF